MTCFFMSWGTCRWLTKKGEARSSDLRMRSTRRNLLINGAESSGQYISNILTRFTTDRTHLVLDGKASRRSSSIFYFQYEIGDLALPGDRPMLIGHLIGIASGDVKYQISTGKWKMLFLHGFAIY